MPARAEPCAWANSGTFENLNPYGVNAGDSAVGLAGPVYESLMARSFDEPFTLYGLIAQTIETNDARDYVAFRLDPTAHFSDGVPVSARDVIFYLQPAQDQGPPAAARRLWRWCVRSRLWTTIPSAMISPARTTANCR